MGLADLGGLRQQLAARAEADRIAQAQARERRAALEREANQFREAVADVAPLRPTGRRSPEPAAVEPIARQRAHDERAALAESLSDEIDVARYLETDDQLSFRRPGIGTDTLVRLRRGHWVTQGRIDLHGLRRDEAREAVVTFLANSVRDGLRCVRIIHGKGLGSVDRKPVLKEKVARWLVQREEVLAFCVAPPTAGGEGAVLVLLRSPNPPNGAL